MHPRPEDLALYEDAALYDATYRRRRQDVEYYVELARSVGGPVLEYGVGTGRVAFALARAGVDVVGVDLSDAMLNLLRRKLSRAPRVVRSCLRLVRGDMTKVALGERFPLVIAPFNAVLHLDHHRDFFAFLTRARQHLSPAGELAFDFPVPHPDDLGADPARWYPARRFRHPVTREWLRPAERFEYDPRRQVLLIETRLVNETTGSESRLSLIHRQWFPREVEALLRYAGYCDVRFFADFTDQPPLADVDSMVVRARP